MESLTDLLASIICILNTHNLPPPNDAQFTPPPNDAQHNFYVQFILSFIFFV